jgi:hypothetical protein
VKISINVKALANLYKTLLEISGFFINAHASAVE